MASSRTRIRSGTVTSGRSVTKGRSPMVPDQSEVKRSPRDGTDRAGRARWRHDDRDAGSYPGPDSADLPAGGAAGADRARRGRADRDRDRTTSRSDGDPGRAVSGPL